MPRAISVKARARLVDERLAALYPGSARELCALCFADPFQLLVATVLSAQCTDARVNAVTPALFARFPSAAALAGASLAELEAAVRPTGFFRTKAAHCSQIARAVTEQHGGVVPSSIEELTALPGVGRKTANVVRSVAFDLPGLPVDTHVGRLARRLALTAASDPVKVEAQLCELWRPSSWGAISVRLILHGRSTCTARSPRCGTCVLSTLCPKVGVAPSAPVGPAGRVAKARP
jgi:endonuclease-3